MGNILRRKRVASAELDEIVVKLKKYESQANEWTEKRQSALWFLAWAIFFLATSGSGYIWLKTSNSNAKMGYCIGTFLVSVILFLFLRIVLRAFFDYLIRLKHSKIQSLTDRKRQIIEDVKENEKFKVAKEILEKYGSKEDLEFLNKTSKSASKEEVKEKAVKEETGVDDESSKSKPESKNQGVVPPNVNNPNQPGQPPRNNVVPVMTPLRNQMPQMGPGSMQTPMRGPVRPFVSPNRTPLDKLVDYIIGDGPNNRYALVCANCHTHNGMALAEEFNYMAYFCYKCNFFNPSKRMRRPSGRPSLPPMPHGLQSSFMNIPPNRSHKNLSELDETAKLDKVDLEETEFKEHVPVQQCIKSTDDIKKETIAEEVNGTPSDPIPHSENVNESS
uniref:Endoplasmic reticulum junction formation protein lunapark n=1 Tax=Acrobeloides nanus TaxID=290746 RepID=A0A914DG39_9BILA